MTKSTIEQRVVLLNAARECLNAVTVMEELGRGKAHVAAVREAGIHLSTTYTELTNKAEQAEAAK